jgi:hypothetical protein
MQKGFSPSLVMTDMVILKCAFSPEKENFGPTIFFTIPVQHTGLKKRNS